MTSTVGDRPADVDALRGHRGRTGGRLFDDAFCDWFAGVDFAGLRIDAVPEGRVVHPNTPITVVEGPLAAAQLIETPLLNQLNFATLIATKAARVVEAAHGRPVLEFGMRRAAAEGADAASRAAIVGGAISTSNTRRRLRARPAPRPAPTPTRWSSCSSPSAAGEQAAFDAYADVYPDDTLLLVDTVDTLGSGIPNAIATFERLRRAGHEPVGIRLDSGDLAYLAVQAARELDRAGFPDTVIVLSSQLDELTIWQITSQIADEARRARRRRRRRDRPARVRRRLAPGHERRRPQPRRRVQARRRRRRRRPVAPGDEALGLPGQGAQPGRQAAVAGLRRPRSGDRRRAVDRATRCSRRERLHLHHHARPDVDRDVTAGRVSTSCWRPSSTAARSSLPAGAPASPT